MAGPTFLKATLRMRNLIVTYLIIRAVRTNEAKGFAQRRGKGGWERGFWFPQ